jgi:hypothetical protein
MYIIILLIFVVSCGGGGNYLVNSLKKDAKTKSVLIVKNASKTMFQSIQLANKLYTHREEELPSGLDCITLGFLIINRDVNLSLIVHKKYAKKSGIKNLVCDIYDYKNFDKNISGQLNKILILNN